MTNPILEEDCRLIYQRHKTILDKIRELAPSGDGISLYAKEFADRIGANIITNTSTRMAYLPNEISKLLPDNTTEMAYWGQSKPVMMWFSIDGKERLKLIFQVGPIKDRDIRQKFIESLLKIYGLKQKRTNSEKYTAIMTPWEQTTEESDLLQLMLNLHEHVASHLTEFEALVRTFKFSADEVSEN